VMIKQSLSANPPMLSNFDDSGLLRRRHWSCRQRDASHSVTVPSRWQLHAPGMPCQHLSVLLHRWRCSAGIWRQLCSQRHMAVKIDNVIYRLRLLTLNVVQCPCSSFLWQHHFNLFIFTLHYITYECCACMCAVLSGWRDYDIHALRSFTRLHCCLNPSAL